MMGTMSKHNGMEIEELIELCGPEAEAAEGRRLMTIDGIPLHILARMLRAAGRDIDRLDRVADEVWEEGQREDNNRGLARYLARLKALHIECAAHTKPGCVIAVRIGDDSVVVPGQAAADLVAASIRLHEGMALTEALMEEGERAIGPEDMNPYT